MFHAKCLLPRLEKSFLSMNGLGGYGLDHMGTLISIGQFLWISFTYSKCACCARHRTYILRMTLTLVLKDLEMRKYCQKQPFLFQFTTIWVTLSLPGFFSSAFILGLTLALKNLKMLRKYDCSTYNDKIAKGIPPKVNLFLQCSDQ